MKKITTVIPSSGDQVDIYYPIDQNVVGENSLPVALFLQRANVDKSNYSEFSNVFVSYDFTVLIPNNLRTLALPSPALSVTGFFPELPQITEALDYIQNSEAFPIAKQINSDKLVLLGNSFGGSVGLSAINGSCPILNGPFGTFTQPKRPIFRTK